MGHTKKKKAHDVAEEKTNSAQCSSSTEPSEKKEPLGLEKTKAKAAVNVVPKTAKKKKPVGPEENTAKTAVKVTHATGWSCRGIWSKKSAGQEPAKAKAKVAENVARARAEAEKVAKIEAEKKMEAKRKGSKTSGLWSFFRGAKKKHEDAKVAHVTALEAWGSAKRDFTHGAGLNSSEW